MGEYLKIRDVCTCLCGNDTTEEKKMIWEVERGNRIITEKNLKKITFWNCLECKY